MAKELSLREKQSLFASLLGKFLVWIYTHPEWEVTIGEVYRAPATAQANAAAGIGIAKSLHIVSLAVDLRFFVKDQYLTKSEDYKVLGDYWKTLHPLCRWGGDFKKPDGNHFSLEHNGVR